MNKPLFGLSLEELEQVEKELRKALDQKHSWVVSVFGSRANGNNRKYSDLDLWIDANPPLTSHELAYLTEAFENSDLSFKVDIVRPETVLPEYLPSISKSKIEWIKQQQKHQS